MVLPFRYNKTPIQIWLDENPDIYGTFSTTLKIVSCERIPSKKIFYKDLDNFVLGTKATFLYYDLLFWLQQTNPSKKKVLVHLPNYDALWIIPQNLGLNVYFFYDFEELQSIKLDEVLAVIVSNPNNPTGKFLSDFDIKILLSILDNVKIISDEIFAPEPFEALFERKLPLISSCNFYRISSLWKCFGIPNVAWCETLDKEFKQNFKSEIDDFYFNRFALIENVCVNDYSFLNVRKNLANIETDSHLWFSVFEKSVYPTVPGYLFELKNSFSRFSWANFSP